MRIRPHLKILALAFVFGFFCFVGAKPISANFIYNIAPVTLSSGYTITGGFVETDINSGTLAAANIVDYEVIVNGLYSYTYTPSNPTPGKNATGVMITPTTISVTPPVASGGSGNFLSFTASDASHPDVTLGVQNLSWRARRLSGVASHLITYDFRDLADMNPVAVGTLSTATEDTLIIATLAPEPSAAMLMLSAIAGLLFHLRRNFVRGIRSRTD